jgi:hypothetical protein
MARLALHDALQHEMVEVGDARLPFGSTTVVALRSAMIAGPAMRAPGGSFADVDRRVVRAPPVVIGPSLAGASARLRDTAARQRRARRIGPAPPPPPKPPRR